MEAKRELDRAQRDFSLYKYENPGNEKGIKAQKNGLDEKAKEFKAKCTTTITKANSIHPTKHELLPKEAPSGVRRPKASPGR